MTEETTAFANARIFDGVPAELREGCVRLAAGVIAEVAGGLGFGTDLMAAPDGEQLHGLRLPGRHQGGGA